MKRSLVFFLAMICLLSSLLAGCSTGLEAPETTVEEAKTTVEEIPSTTTEEKKEAPDPAEDDVLNVLIIGNSFSTYYPDELIRVANAAGVKMRVYSVYYSGCKMAQHWEWNRFKEGHYTLYIYNDPNKERSGLGNQNLTLDDCLEQENWDYISLQQHFGPRVNMSYDDCYDSVKPYAKSLYTYISDMFPKANLLWHQTWAYEVGYARDDGPMTSTEQQSITHENIRAASQQIAKDCDVTLLPAGDAWAIARKNPVIGDTLCQSSAKNNGAGDHYHDGQEGGGQYLNACVWFEMLTGKSCIGNTWRPSYQLSEEKVAALQSAAHEAVAAIHGTDFAK